MAGLLFAGSLLLFAATDPRWQAAGLSLLVPGGGLLYVGAPVLFALWLALFGLALVLWWGVSAVLAPAAVIVTGAVLPMLLAPDSPADCWWWAVPVLYLLYAAAIGTAVVRAERAHRVKVAAVPELNEYLARTQAPVPTRTPREPDELDARMLGFLLELGLQPLDEFAGFDHGEQFHGGTCLRYQLTMLGSALAVAQVNLLPNFPGLIERAQRNLIDKQTDIRVWRYWRIENILGNLRWDPDPITRDNIMFSGFLASQLGEFEAATGSTHFDRPGSLTFTWRDGRRFRYDHHSLIDAVARNFRRADLGIFPCEPGWVFSVCNAMAAQGVRSYDVTHRSGVWAKTEPGWRAGIFGEMMTPDGNIRHLRSALFGFTFNDGDGTGEYPVSGNHNFQDTAPDMALRGTLLQLRGVAEKLAALEALIDGDGVLALPVTPKPERGTRYVTALTEWLGIIAGAMAVGNDRVARAAERALLRQCGVAGEFPTRPLDGGLMIGAALMMVIWGTPLSVADLAQRGYRPPAGPLLLDAPWPALLVTKARSTDGSTLDLVVEPHRAAPGERHVLRFGTTGGRYRLVGPGVDELLEPDADGRCTVSVTVERRMPLTLRPA